MKKKFTIALATIALFAVGLSGCDKLDKVATPDPIAQATKVEQNGAIQMLSVKIDTSEYETYGVSESAKSAHLVTASWDGYVDDPAVDWTISWDSATAGEWTRGKTVGDYVTVTPTADGALTAVVEMLQGYNGGVKVTCTSRQDASLKDDFVCFYTGDVSDCEHTETVAGVCTSCMEAVSLLKNSGESISVGFATGMDAFTYSESLELWNGGKRIFRIKATAEGESPSITGVTATVFADGKQYSAYATAFKNDMSMNTSITGLFTCAALPEAEIGFSWRYETCNGYTYIIVDTGLYAFDGGYVKITGIYGSVSLLEAEYNVEQLVGYTATTTEE